MTSTATRPASAVARFVAYEHTPERIANPDDGTAIPVRAETFVEEYASIKLSSCEEKSSNGFDTVYVKFDASSAGNGKMEFDFGASAEVGSLLATRLNDAWQSGTPIYVAIETSRRKKMQKSGEPIDVQTSIHTLRGATGDDLKGDPQATKANCRRVVVAAGAVGDPHDTVFASGQDLRSDPSEWAQLRKNRRGDIAPEGWRCIMHNGHRTGGITDHKPQANTDSAAIARAVVQELAAHNNHPPQLTASNAGAPGGVRRAHATEARPWEPLNSDNRPNPGGWAAAKYRTAYEAAINLFHAAGENAAQLDPAAENDHVWKLAEILLWIADQVQQTVLGTTPDRTASSHKEALDWVALMIKTRHPYTVEHITSLEASKLWAQEVAEAASQNYSIAYSHLARYLGVDLDIVVDAAPTADKDPHAVRRWQELADKIGMSKHIMKLSFVLAETFKVRNGVLKEIDAAAFSQQVETWHTNPQKFLEIAQLAYQKANPAHATTAS